MKILIIANAKVLFRKELQNELIAKGLNVSLLDFASLTLYDKYNTDEHKYKIRFQKFKSIPKLSMFFRMWYIKKVIQECDFTVVNIHISRWPYILILPWLTKQKLVITFYGSDFYRTSNFIKKIQTILYKKADAITFTNPLTKDSFLEYYKDFNDKSYVCRFGLKTIEFIDKNRDKPKDEIKKALGYKLDKIIVTCGYNSTQAQQHEKIIESILKLNDKILEKIQFIFPMTYGDNIYKENIKNILKNTALDYIVLEDFLYADDNAYIKLASDIMINVLETDSFSGSMQEFIYADNVVITGSWLPYEVLDEEGITYHKVDKLQELAYQLEEIISELKERKKVLLSNRPIIHRLTSWKNNIEIWRSVFETTISQ